ncbi:class I SAM-dependent methyltransferase [Pseudoalteromonas byunsanensis]|uniref:Methyltransferase type 11 domain-containing protein n=1 Tax=Pseudoalteromonas byunsanensis TaxID=327939 RepID=A0A1S1NEK7_9GAMM|nr:class I SAM-dependent methyltransferase [Pseudoalteromonas byunsanensis]OHU98143.1 hypothetical protein BIW53_00020 [Pseudoalteromonas byunsanensis]
MYNTSTHGKTLYDDWLNLCDSVIPPPLSVRSNSYRRWLSKVISVLADKNDKVLSIGSGIGAAEKYFKEKSINITASDIHPRSLEICRSKGLETISLDIRSYNSGDLHYDVIYADGVLGHIWEDENSGSKIWENLKSLSRSGFLLLSNDISDDENINLTVTGMPDERFFRPPGGWFSNDAEKHGLKLIFSRLLAYKRRGKKRYREVIVLSANS